MDADLFSAALWVAALGTLALLRVLGWRGALVCVGLKVSLAAGYFAWFDDGGWRLLDDLTYAEEGRGLLAEGLGPAQLLSGQGQVTEVMSFIGSRNFGYFLYNALAIELFGDHYWAPVLLNVFATFLAGAGLSRVATLAGSGRAARRGLVAFFLLHWDVLVWSSFLNLKDSLVLTLTVGLFAFALSLVHRPRLGSFFGLAVTLVVVSVVRWYVTLLFAAAFVGWGVMALRGGRRALLVFLALGALFPLATQTPNFSLFDPGALLSGGLAFLITPRPWGVAEEYEFLRLPALLHWLTLPLLPVGGLLLWRRHRYLQPLVLFALLTWLFYANLPWLNGPRHRFQLVFVLAWMQFAAAGWLLREVLAGRQGTPRPSGEEALAP